MYEQKTKQTEQSVIDFIEQIESHAKKEDAYALLQLFEETTSYPAKMWGASIIGFGSYHYKYPSGHEGDAALVGFSPRKAKISLYMAAYDTDRDDMLVRLGKHTAGAGCVYINKLKDVDMEVIKELIVRSMEFLRKTYPDDVKM